MKTIFLFIGKIKKNKKIQTTFVNYILFLSCSLIPGFELADFEARKYGDLMQEN